jgi:hypothetical protein
VLVNPLCDIRGTQEAWDRRARVLDAAPHLSQFLAPEPV